MNILAWLLDKPFYYQKIVKVNIFVFKRICINYLHKCIEYFFNYFNDKTLHWIYWKHYYLFMYVVYQCEHFLQTRGRHPPHFDKNGIFWGGGGSSPTMSRIRRILLQCLVLLVWMGVLYSYWFSNILTFFKI